MGAAEEKIKNIETCIYNLNFDMQREKKKPGCHINEYMKFYNQQLALKRKLRILKEW